MASLGDLTLFISAETGQAKQGIADLGVTADKTVNKKREFDFSIDKARNNIRELKRDIETVGSVLKTTYNIAKNTPLFDDQIQSAEQLVKTTKSLPQIAKNLQEGSKAGNILKSSLESVVSSAGALTNNLTKVGIALFGLQQIANALKATFGGFFNATIGQSIKLRETILKTQTALASTNDVYKGGKKIEDPFQKIVALTGAIDKRVESIRKRSIDLAGVTGNDVIEVFSMVSSQIGAVGGGLKDAEDLAISFSAALGTFGIPLYQARQEIGSILRGDITADSYLAKALGITNEDISKAKTSTEGVIGFLQSKLQVAVAGQALAAKSFSGVTSNLRDLAELMGEAFGAPMVEPLVAGLNKVYKLLSGIKDQATGAAKALGGGLGAAASIIGTQSIGNSRTASGGGAQAKQMAEAAARAVDNVSTTIEALAGKLATPLKNLFDLLAQGVAALGTGLGKLAVGLAGLKVEVFTQLLYAVQNLLAASQPLIAATGSLLGLYGQFLNLPLVEYLSSIAAQMKLLEMVGVTGVAKLVLGFVLLQGAFTRTIAAVGALAASLIGGLGQAMTVISTGLIVVGQALQALLTKLGAVIPALGLLATQMNAAGVAAGRGAVGMNAMAVGAGALGKSAGSLVMNFVKFNAILLAVTIAIAVAVDAFGRLQRAQEKATSDKRTKDALKSLNGELKDVDENSTAAARAQKELAESIVSAKLAEQKEAFGAADKKVEELVISVQKLKQELKDRQAFAFGLDIAGIDAIKNKLLSTEQELQKAAGQRFGAEKEYIDTLTEYEKGKKRETINEEVQTRARDLGAQNEKLAQQQKQLAKDIANAEFGARIELARKEIELFNAQENIKLQQIDQRARKVIASEEGASAAALEALNTYFIEKKRGEIDIEAQRRELVIKTAEIEKRIQDYKFEIAEKVLELTKQGAKVTMAAADHARKQAEATALQSGDTFQTTGGKSGVTASTVAGFPITSRQGMRLSHPVTGGQKMHAGTDIGTPMNTSLSYSQGGVVTKAGTEGGYGKVLEVKLNNGIKIFAAHLNETLVKAGDKFQARQLLARTGNTGTSTGPHLHMEGAKGGDSTEGLPYLVLGGKASKVNPAPVAGSGSPTGAAAPQNRAPNVDAMAAGVSAPSTGGFEQATRAALGLESAIAAVNAQSKEITNQNNLEAFFEKLAPKIPVEQFKDLILQTKAYSEASRLTFDPEKADIYAKRLADVAIFEREIKETIAAASKEKKISAEEIKKLEAEARKRFYGPGGTKEQLDDEVKLRLQSLMAQKAQARLQEMQRQITNIPLERTQAINTGKAGLAQQLVYDPREKFKLGAKAELANEAASNEQAMPGWETAPTAEAEKLREAFQKLSETKLYDAERQGEFQAFADRFQQLSTIADGIGTSVATAMSYGVASILDGTKSVNEVLATMFQSIGESFMQMAMQIIAEMVKMIALKSLLGIFGMSLPSSGGGGASAGIGGILGGLLGGGGKAASAGNASSSGGSSFTPGAAFAPGVGANMDVWKRAQGGIYPLGFKAFAQGGVADRPTLGLVGEGAYNEAIVPLPNGKAIPVDMKGSAGGAVTTNITVNVDSEGGAKTEMSGDQAGKLGKAIDNAVKRVILEEKRRGGMLGGR